MKTLASRYGLRGPHGFARRFVAGESVADAIAVAAPARGGRDSSRRSTSSARASPRWPTPIARPAPTSRLLNEIAAAGIGRERLAEAHAARTDRRPRHLRRQPAAHPRRRGGARASSCASTWRTRATRRSPSTSSRRCGSRAIATPASSCSRTCRGRIADVRRMNALGARVRLVKGAYREPRRGRLSEEGAGRRGVHRDHAGAARPRASSPPSRPTIRR